MKKGCEAFMSGWSEQVEKALIKRESNAEIEDKICRTMTHVFSLFKYRLARVLRKARERATMIS
jgi:hypothetical protein